MGMFRSIVDRLVVRTLGRNEYESVALRRYFDRRYGIKVGLYSFGAFDRWRVPPGTVIGRYCSIAKSARLLDANHPTDALSTHPYFYLKEFDLVGGDRIELRPPVVGDDVWLGHSCIITPACNRIGRGAIIGAGAVVTSDVEPYAIMAGAPARLLRYRFTPEIIEAIETSQWWLLDKNALKRAFEQAPGFVLKPSGETAAAFLEAARRTAALGRPELRTAGAATQRV
jgi:virginiamycin A acetyltransferase